MNVYGNQKDTEKWGIYNELHVMSFVTFREIEYLSLFLLKKKKFQNLRPRKLNGEGDGP